MKYITIKGAREHNLKNINLKLPRRQFIVITGLSGSGKSSLAFDTIYSEGQRRYLESFSSYARQFLEKMQRSDCDKITGLSPTISIEQRQITKNPRSTVGTVTEIYDYLRLLFAKIGTIECYSCGREVGKRTRDEIIDVILKTKNGGAVTLYAPVVRGRKGEYKKLFEELKKKGFTRLRIDGKMYDIEDVPRLKKTQRHTIDVIVDRIRITDKNHNRLSASVNTALDLAEGVCIVRDEKANRERLFSEKLSCTYCDISFNELAPNMFSFNSPYGACSECHGLGKVSKILSRLVIKDETKPLLRGALNKELFFLHNKYFIEDLVSELSHIFAFHISTPYCDLSDEVKDAFFWGNDTVYGLLDELRDQINRVSSENVRAKLRKCVQEDICSVCEGSRLKKESLAVRIGDFSIARLCKKPIERIKEFFDNYSVSLGKEMIAAPILKEIKDRLQFLVNIGVGYLSIDRPVATLGGGELQRIKLGSQIGIGLSGVLYILDEPSIGLHPRDNSKLLQALFALRDMNNTVIVVEHDEETIRSADYVVDLGPGAGALGGYITGQGPVSKFMESRKSLTAKYLRGELSIPVPEERKKLDKNKSITVKNAQEHNLKGITVNIPLGVFTCVTGVSGSGKSTLIHDTLYPALRNKIWKAGRHVGMHDDICGYAAIDKIIEIDQSPIGRTPRSNPATYIDLFVHIRKLFATMPEAKLRGYSASRFSFNLKGGRCETCKGEGAEKLEMSFLPDVYVTCYECNGKRYNEQTLEILFKNKNMYDVLEMSVAEALDFFSAIPPIREKLEVLYAVGLSYIKLGQASTTLSGGEPKGVNLASELSRRAPGKPLYLLDEPTTGLHFHDIHNLMNALLELRDAGNTIVIIEHNLDVIKMADHIIDLGPEGGARGGFIVAQGTPEEVVKVKGSYTGKYLKAHLQR